jgi:hypothetical protein
MPRDLSGTDDGIDAFARYGAGTSHAEPGMNGSETPPEDKERGPAEHVGGGMVDIVLSR